MNPLRTVHAAVFVIVAVHAALSAPAAAQDSPAVREMMEVSGIIDQFGDLGETFRAGINAASAGKMPPEIAEGLADIAARHVRGPDLLNELEKSFELGLAPDQVAAITDFYRTPLGRHVAEAELASSSVDAQLDLEARRGEVLAQLEEEPERMALARRIDDALFASELSTTTGLSVARAMALGILNADPQAATPEMMAAFERQFEALREPTLKQMREGVHVSIGWTYRDLSTEELTSYAEFLETEAARAAYATLFEVFHNYLSEQSVRIGEDFVAFLRGKRT